MKKNNNVYKPRYKVAFQAKSKIWAYKNSHLRHFFSIRGRRMYRGGFFRKNVLVATTLKWTVARRFIKPYTRSIRANRGKSKYKNRFYLKQQLRHFYGKITEVAFRNIYKTHLLNTWNRNKSFFGALEQRVDMFLYRMRLLPTIYACNQFIHHQGILINRKRIEKCPSSLVRIGFMVSLPKIYWQSIANYLTYRVYYRVFGKIRLKKRTRNLLKRKIFWLTARKNSKWLVKKKRQFHYWRNKLKIVKIISKLGQIARYLQIFYIFFMRNKYFLKYSQKNSKLAETCIEIFLYRKKIFSTLYFLFLSFS